MKPLSQVSPSQSKGRKYVKMLIKKLRYNTRTITDVGLASFKTRNFAYCDFGRRKKDFKDLI